MNHQLVNVGSVRDIKGSLECNPDAYDIIYLKSQVLLERAGRNRSTVIKMLQAEIKRKQKADKK